MSAGAATSTEAPLNPWLEDRLRRLGGKGLVLDVGCGRGYWLGRMAADGLRVIGVEPDVMRARVGAGHAPVAAGDGTRLPIASGAMSLVWCIHVLHHLPDPVAALAEFRRVLRPDGHLILAETVDDNPLVRAGRRIHPEWDGVHIHSRFTAAALLDLVAESGLEVVERRLAGDPRTGRFCHGDAPTLADCVLVPQIVNAQRFECRLDHLPTVVRVFDACMALPAFATTQPSAYPEPTA